MPTGFTEIKSGKSNGRNVYDDLIDGRITITGTDSQGKTYQRIAVIRDGEVWDNTLRVNGRVVHRIVYGQFETIRQQKGRTIVRFKKGTGRGIHGKARRHESLFGHEGCCHSWYKNGRLVRQKFIYDNRRLAYDFNAYKKECTVRDYDGNPLYEIKGVLTDRNNNIFIGSHSVLAGPMHNWFNPSVPFEVRKNHRVVLSGQVKNAQRVGKWIIGGKTYFYINGAAIPKKLFETPPENLDPAKVLKINNAQLRMAMMEKIGTDRIADIGKVVHKDGDMRLYDIPKYDVRILRVRCSTTKVFYYLRVPKDATKCEEARQWTFHVGQDFSKPIKFAIET